MNIAQEMIGKWAAVLPDFIDSKYLTGKHMDCPICKEGKDRFRFDDKNGRGTYFCSQCGPGDGFSLIIGATGRSFRDIAMQMQPMAASALPVIKPKPDISYYLDAIAMRCQIVKQGDAVSQYLQGRGINAIPIGIRLVRQLRHKDRDGSTTDELDAMVARITDIQGKRAGFHITWIKDGKKAPVNPPRKIYKQAETISGSGVYLGKVNDIVVIGEGIETTLAGMSLSNCPGIAGLNTQVMQSIKLPSSITSVIVLADNDVNYAGQKAAYTLANRLVREGKCVSVQVPEKVGTDFADMTT